MEHEKTLIGNGLGRRRWGYFVHSGGRRGAHGVTRPTALGTRQVLSISLPILEFGLKASWNKRGIQTSKPLGSISCFPAWRARPMR
jgi:hypothetical protein